MRNKDNQLKQAAVETAYKSRERCNESLKDLADGIKGILTDVYSQRSEHHIFPTNTFVYSNYEKGNRYQTCYRVKCRNEKKFLEITLQREMMDYGTIIFTYRTLATFHVEQKANSFFVKIKDSGWFSRFKEIRSFLEELVAMPERANEIFEYAGIVRDAVNTYSRDKLKVYKKIAEHSISTKQKQVRISNDNKSPSLKKVEVNNLQPPLLEGKVIDGYHVVKLIATGGFGQVYLVESSIGIKKTMKVPYQKFGLESLERELMAAKTLNHPNILHIEHADLTTKEVPYALMAYEPEVKNFEEIGQNLTLEQRLNILLQVGEALDYAHKQQVLHCDVKPTNILVTKDLRALLTDFGLAKCDPDLLVKNSLILSGVHNVSATLIRGTLDYLAPEIFRGEQPTVASDIYSFGLTCFEAIIGRLPYKAENIRHTLINSHITEKMINAITKALEIDQTQRYRSISEFIEGFFFKKKKSRENKRTIKTKKEMVEMAQKVPEKSPADKSRAESAGTLMDSDNELKMLLE